MKFLIIFFLIVNFLYAKKDFYYSFINSSGIQISEQRKQKISDGFDLIQNARQLAKDGKVDEAYAQIKSFKDKNRLKVLNSDIILLYSELSLKKESKRFIVDGAKVLEEAINSSKINEYDLPRAYELLVDLKLESNRSKDAKYFAEIIVNNFNDKIVKTRGKIALAKVYKYQKEPKMAIRILYEILTKTKDKEVATIVANELFDLYIFTEEFDKANELISQVLKNNIDFYANDSYLANKKINKLIKANMPRHAANILKELLNRTTKEESIEDFKFKLANTYMLMYDGTNYYLEKAKALYEDIINDYSQGAYFQKAKMYIDEILMRQNILKTTVVSQKYENSESMQQKALLQELINEKEGKQFDKILRKKKIYRTISDTIARRFGYDSMTVLFDEVNIDRIKMLLNDDQCFTLHDALQTARSSTLERLIEDDSVKYKFFQCLIDVPYERAYTQIKNTFNTSRDANIYLYLEKMALALGLYDEALDFSAKVEMVNNKDILSKEFLIRYKIIKHQNDTLSLDKFFSYATRNKQFIEQNKNNPVIVDFYYDYYFYLLKHRKKDKAVEFLQKLYEKQKEINAFVYSPFVEMSLAKLQEDENNIQKSKDYLLEGLKNTRRIKPNDEVKVYYDLINIYNSLNNQTKKQEYILKCKEVNGTVDSLYKKMCDEM
ncbi:tetratricopeptide repeat protein [Arcobacter sp. YIC-310]|uniref:tetratricopeptide repeat protein n=1 Tax=Arcobacter sp. YIC-310 TaxID=3376632 RepID=UPI003C14A342